MRRLLNAFARPLFYLSRKARARAAYQRAFNAHWTAIRKGDTRRIHETRAELLAANTERMRVGA